MANDTNDIWTTGRLNREHGLPAWWLRYAEQRGLIPQSRRAGMVRCWRAGDVPKILAAARLAGHAPQVAPDATQD